jgi:hypothetical protein
VQSYIGRAQEERDMQNMRIVQKKRWADLSPLQKTCVIIGGTLQIGLLVAGLWDVAHRSADEVRGDRRMWVGLMFINWLGPLAYFAYGRKKSPLRFWACGAEQRGGEPTRTEEAAGFAGSSVV